MSVTTRIKRVSRCGFIFIVSHLASVCCITVGMCGTPALPVGIPFHRETVGGPVCGLLCVRAAFAALGATPPSIDALLHPKYLGDIEGSSVGELCAAIADHGLVAMPVHNMSQSALAVCQYPVILHVNNAMRSNGYRHWLVFLGAIDDDFKLVDPPGSPETVTRAQLMSMWDGSGVVVSNISASTVQFSVAWIAIEVIPMLCAALLLLSLTSVWYERQRVSALKTVKCHLISIFAIAAVLAVIRNSMFADGMLLDVSAVRAITQRYGPRPLPEVTYDELLEMLPHGAILVDARLPRDFEQGFIQGAVNIPTYATHQERSAILSPAATSTPVVVYCQSQTCRYADRVANAILTDGFETVLVYREGWRGWLESIDNGLVPLPEDSL